MYQNHRLLTHVAHDLTSFDPSLECGDHDAFDTVFELDLQPTLQLYIAN
jgi:hypothetical protein